MPSINKVFLLGNVGSDPELRTTQNGKSVVSFNVATEYNSGDKKRTEWHRCVAWDKTAEIVGDRFYKGCKVHLEGRLQTRQFEKDGTTHHTTEIICERVLALSYRDRQGEHDTTNNSDDMDF